MNRLLKFGLASVAIGIAVLALKYAAYRATGSLALYSDALESIINVAAAMTAALTLHLSAKPADADHPYGHYKAEYFSAVFEGVLIVVAALLIFREAIEGYLRPKPFDIPPLGVALSVAATAVNAAWAYVLLRQGRQMRSPALTADGKHLFSDVLSSLGVLVGICLATALSMPVLDPILAGLVAVNILWSGWALVRDSVGGLMDASTPQADLDRIRGIISANSEGALEAHDLRTRHAGRMTFIDFHLVVPGQMSVSGAHEICDRIEAALKTTFLDVLVTIHVEPEDKAKHSGIVVL